MRSLPRELIRAPEAAELGPGSLGLGCGNREPGYPLGVAPGLEKEAELVPRNDSLPVFPVAVALCRPPLAWWTPEPRPPVRGLPRGWMRPVFSGSN